MSTLEEYVRESLENGDVWKVFPSPPEGYEEEMEEGEEDL